MAKSRKNESKTEVVIRGKVYSVTLCQLKHEDLRFYTENPRVYSALHESGKAPKQDDIYDFMKELDHVRELRENIKKNGGLIEPLYVKEATNEVIEGNSRLAAYRLLSEDNAVDWEWVKCAILPKEVPESGIASLLGELHLKGKKDWAPYEQASYLHRRHYKGKVSIPTLSDELDISEMEIKRKINVIDKMIEHNDNTTAHWSHYDELVKSRKIQKACEDHPDLEQTIVDLIKDDEIKAVEVRAKLKTICSTKSEKPLKQFIEDKNIDGAFKTAKAMGGDNTTLQRIRKFRSLILTSATTQSLESASARIKGEAAHELRKIRSQVEKLLKILK